MHRGHPSAFPPRGATMRHAAGHVERASRGLVRFAHNRWSPRFRVSSAAQARAAQHQRRRRHPHRRRPPRRHPLSAPASFVTGSQISTASSSVRPTRPSRLHSRRLRSQRRSGGGGQRVGMRWPHGPPTPPPSDSAAPLRATVPSGRARTRRASSTARALQHVGGRQVSMAATGRRHRQVRPAAASTTAPAHRAISPRPSAVREAPTLRGRSGAAWKRTS